MKKYKMFMRANSVNISKKKDNNKSKNHNININVVNKRRIDDIIYFLSDEIKQYHQLIKIFGPHHKNVESIYEKILSRLSENNYEIIQFILNKKKRTNEELIIIKTFLSTMKYLSSMINLIDTDKILFSLSIYLKMESKPKDTILFRYGNKGKKFYILLSGRVTILLLKETKVKMSFLRFVLHLFLLKMMKENELVRKTIISNYKNKFHLDEKSFEVFFEKIVNFAEKKLGKGAKDKQDEIKDEIDEESFEESDEINDSGKKNKESSIKKVNTLQFNYLLSNDTSNYKFEIKDRVRPDSKIEEIKNNLTKLNKRKSIGHKSPLKRNKLFESLQLSFLPQSEYSEIGSTFFKKEEELKEIVSYYLHLKKTLGNVRKNRISLKDYIRDTYINSFHRKEIKEDEFVEKEQFIIFVYHEIVQKTKGDTFGELALQHEDSKRTATIITNTDIILGYLTKSDYEACLSEIEIKRRKTEVNFIMSFSIFDKMNWINFENKYFNFFKREYYSQGESIMKQGEKISKIIFIMDGQFEITSSLSILSLYKILRQKTNYSFKKINIRIKKKINNIRLYICNNKDILGLNDSCFFGLQGEQISFITATCISNKSIAFTLDKSILDDLQNKMSEINENLKIVINKREEVMIDRLTSIFNQLIKNKRSDIIDKQTSIIYKNNNRYIYNNSSVLNKNKNNNVFNNNKNREIYSPYKNFILSAKHRETSPISIYIQNKIDTNSRNENQMIEQNSTHDKKEFLNKYMVKMNLSDSEEYKNNNILRENEIIYSTDDIEYKKRITNIMAIKNNMHVKVNPRVYLKSAVTIRELNEKRNVKEKMKNLYKPLNNIIHREYNCLFNWIDYNKRLSQSYKKVDNEESENKNININANTNYDDNKRKESEFGDSKKLSFSSDNQEDKNDKNENVPFKISKKKVRFSENYSNDNSNLLISLKKDKNTKKRRTLKNLEMEEEFKRQLQSKFKSLKKGNSKSIKLFSRQNNNKNINKKVNKYTNTEYMALVNNKMNIFKKPFSTSKTKLYLKNRVKNNENYLKQILGTRYRNQEDEFISRTEKKILKEIDNYNENIKKKNEIKLKYSKKNSEKNIFSQIRNKEYNSEDGHDLLSSNNFNIKNLKKIYVK